MHDKPNDDANGWLWLGRALAKRGQLEHARSALRRALLLSDGYSRLSDEAAVSLEALGFDEDVTILLQRKCELAPHARGPRLDLARAWSRRGDTQRLEQALMTARQLDPADDSMRLDLASMLESIGRYEEAISELLATKAYRLDEAPILRRLARLFGLSGAQTDCVRTWRRVVSSAGRHVDADDLTAYGIALSQADRHDAAIEVLQHAVRRRADGETYANLGMAQIRAGQAGEAIDSFSAALTDDQGSVQACLGLGVALRLQGQANEAVEYLQRVTNESPNWEVGFFELGIALKQSGHLVEARAAFLRAAMLAPEDPGIRAELRSVLKEEPTPGSAEDETDASSVSGTLTSFPLLDILEFLRFQRLTGTLVIQSQNHGVGHIRLHRGQLVSARAPGNAALDEFEGADDRDTRLTGARAALQELSDWRVGQFSFHRAEQEPDDEQLTSIDLATLLLEIARRKDEKGKV